MVEFICSEIGGMPKNIYYSSSKNILGLKVKNYYEISDWLKEIRDAKFVITDSFHAICFCLLFEKNFICFPNKKRGVARVKSLLNSLGLLDRIYCSVNDMRNGLSWKRSINYTRIQSLLDVAREESNCFLSKALQE
jgi:hypothetical protein